MIHGGDIEPVNRRNTANAERVKKVIEALSPRYTHDRVPGAIGAVLLPHEYILERTDLGQQQSDIQAGGVIS